MLWLRTGLGAVFWSGHGRYLDLPCCVVVGVGVVVHVVAHAPDEAFAGSGADRARRAPQ